MNRVLITAAGAPNGVAAIRAFQSYGWHVTGIDPDPLAGGLRLADEGIVGPMAGPDLERFLLDREQDFDLMVICIVDDFAWATDIDIPAFKPGLAAVNLCDDKWAFSRLMDKNRIWSPPTSLGRRRVAGPWVVKPRRGRGSRRVVQTGSAEVVDALCNEHLDLIVQQRLSGSEFHLEGFAWHGQYVGGFAHESLVMKGGSTKRSKSFKSKTLDRFAARVVEATRFHGPFNLGGFMTHVGPAVVEVNPRISPSFILGEFAGAKMVKAYVDGAMGVKPSADDFDYEVQTIDRVASEVIV